MGYPALIGLALAAAGTGMQMSAAAQSKKAMNKTLEGQLRKVKEHQAAATPVFEKNLAASGGDAVKSRMEGSRQVAQAMYARTAPSKSPLPVDEARLSGQVGQAREYAARGEAYREEGTDQWVRNQEAARQIGVINNLASSSAGVAPILTQLAGNKGAGLAGLGSLISTAGSLASIYGAVNAKQPQPQVGSKVGGHSNNQTVKVG